MNKPKLLFLADARSPTAINWILYFVQNDFEVHLVSSYPAERPLRTATYDVLPLAFSGRQSIPNQEVASAIDKPGNITYQNVARGLFSPKIRTAIRQWLGPYTIPAASKKLKALVEQYKPDLVHAMRIPYEGMTAALSNLDVPLIVSVWGNDFTLHASSTPWMKAFTRRTMQQIDGLHTDCQRDIRLAEQWGFSPSKPSIVLPGGGGIQSKWFFPADKRPGQVVIHARGFRAYIRNDTFFKSIPLVLEKMPGTQFMCVAMQDESEAHQWVDKLGIRSAVTLLPKLSREEMASHFQKARVAVSPSIHDGTPNTLLEAMACGCLPVAGDIESIREWIHHGVNGLLAPPDDPHAFAEVVIQGLKDDALYENARSYNYALVTEKSAYLPVMKAAARFYQNVIDAAK